MTRTRAPQRPSRNRGRTRHLMIGAFLATLVSLLLIQGFTTKTVGASGEGSVNGTAASPLAGHAAVSRSEGQARADPEPALAADGGADVRRRAESEVHTEGRGHSPRSGSAATFFEVGAWSFADPDITRMLVRDGFEIGNHTFTHANLAAMPSWEAAAQVGAD